MPSAWSSESPPAEQVLRLLRHRGETVAVAESVTGGLLAAALTSQPGASQVFLGSVTAYATALKQEILGVDAALLAERGAVDAEVARQLAVGVRDRLGADWGVATTGVAGPASQDGQSVGTVHVAIVSPSVKQATAQRLFAQGDRAAIRSQSVDNALVILRDALIGSNMPEVPGS